MAGHSTWKVGIGGIVMGLGMLNTKHALVIYRIAAPNGV